MDDNDNLKYLINPPTLLDENFEVVEHYMSSSLSSSVWFGIDEIHNPTTHTLKDNGNGSYTYKKYPSEKLLSSSGSITGSPM